MTAEIIDAANELVEQNLQMAIQAHRLNRNLISAEKCNDCDEPIKKERRDAYPGCTMCVDCQSDVELRKKQQGI